MAEERARNRAGENPSGNGFVTERARAKEALRAEVSTYTGENVRKIAAAAEAAPDDRILRVAAYCRVSTDDIDQLLSIELQKNNYRDMIRGNPKWRYVGTYVDDGFSGTNTDHRPAFKLMMRDAMAGKIDMIITKSVSRFARNLLDCIGWVRELKDKHDPPIAVFFEQEHLNTLDVTSNIILFVLAMVAEEESHMKSEAMLLSLEWRFSRGRFMTPALLGYDRVEVPDGNGGHRKKLVVNEDEANTVRLMYYMLLNGSSTAGIAKTLTDLHRETGLWKVCGKRNTSWTSNGVSTVLRNERYCGDVLARKTWTPNFHDHKSKKNRGKKNKYYQPAHHEAIVTRAQWNAAQRILNSHRFQHKGGYLPMKVIDHGALTGYISINRGWAGYDADEYYRVGSIAMGLAEGEMETDLENEHLPDGGRRLNGMTDDNGVQRIARTLSRAEQEIKAQLEGKEAEEETREETPKIKKGF
ncbi:MAG: recombinase family protein, partial [Clostridiales bacterium]|nr:recombinase family protein [Clostridiales bacterium]